MGIVDVKRNGKIPKCKHWHWTCDWGVCHNLSLGLTTKVRACKGVGQE